MKNFLKLMSAVLLLGMMALPAKALMQADPEWTPQITLNHFSPRLVWADQYGFYLQLERSVGNSTYYMVLNMSLGEDGTLYVEKYCMGDEKICLSIGNGKDCEVDGFSNPWCYYHPEK